MIPTTGDYDMTIITLGCLYFILSCRLTPIDALPVQYEQCMGSRVTCVLTGPHLSSEVNSEALWVRFFVGFWCEDTRHVGSLVLGTPLAFLLAELATGRDAGPAPGPMPRPGLD
jgi:hypothetical protein